MTQSEDMDTAAKNLVLERLAQKWPARLGNELKSFSQVRQYIEVILKKADVPITGSYHYSLLTKDFDAGQKQFKELLDTDPKELYSTKVDAFAIDFPMFCCA